MSVRTVRFANVGFKLGEYFHPLEGVGRGSETQLQVGENIKKIT